MEENKKPEINPKATEVTEPNKPPKKSFIKRFWWVGIIIVVAVVGIIAIALFFHKDTSKPKTSSQTVTLAKQSTVTIPNAINPVNPKAIPVGDGNVSSSSPKNGSIYACQIPAGGGGGNGTGPWLNNTAKTWDSTTKTAVSGAVAWPSANYQVSVSQNNRIITGNDLPINGQTTGIYPIQKTDKAYMYDGNPNKIASQTISLTLPLQPSAASKPGCLNMDSIGILSDGVALFNGLDGESRDAAVHETLDSCDGHPQQSSEYHHHNIPSCILAKHNTPNTSSLVGYANDGYGIYVERDSKGNLLTNANLDECHGRTSSILWDGKNIDMYHYVATIEYPYTLGCFHGASQVKQTTPAMGLRQAPIPPR